MTASQTHEAGPKYVTAAGTQLPVRPEWLALQQEEIVDPEMPVIDAHHHLWDPPGRRYLFDEFLWDVSTGHNVAATVFAQCHAMYRADGPYALKPVGETEFVAGVAAQSESGAYGPAKICAAIVGSVDFALGDGVAEVLEAHIRAGGGRFKGIRGRTSWDASPEVHKLPTPPGVMMEKATRDAVRQIQRAGLTFDIWAFHTQMDEAFDLCAQFPDLPIVINHVAGPLGAGPYAGRRSEIFPVWASKIRRLAELPNTYMKVGGLGMRFTGYEFHLQDRPPSSDDLARAWGPYVETCIQAFGPARCMFESNFPVDKAMCSYPVLWNAFKKMSAAYAPEERARLLSGTAARFYGIEI
jgi:predicted TIM-barrel fold metal-dependent hydrolase